MGDAVSTTRGGAVTMYVLAMIAFFFVAVARLSECVH